MIPILFTAGLIMNALGLLHFLWKSENNPAAGLPIWLVAVVFLFGLSLWGLTVMNMLVVKQLLNSQSDVAAS